MKLKLRNYFVLHPNKKHGIIPQGDSVKGTQNRTKIVKVYVF